MIFLLIHSLNTGASLVYVVSSIPTIVVAQVESRRMNTIGFELRLINLCNSEAKALRNLSLLNPLQTEWKFSLI